METRLLRMFQAVARHGGLAGAAVELHVTPSALSHALKVLELSAGCRLFDRVGNKLLLNQAGEHLLAGIEEPLRTIDRVAQSVRELGKWGQGRIRIGASAAACQYLLPPVLRELKKEFPRIHLVVESGDMPHLAGLLRDHRIDLAVGVQLEHAQDLEQRALFEDELFLTISSTHPWNDQRSLTAAEIARETLILYQRNSSTARLVTQFLQWGGLEPGATMEVASIPAIKELVRLNLGIAVLAPWVAETELVRGALKMRPLGSRSLKRRWMIASLSGRALTLGEERFCKLCRAQATGLRKGRKDLPSRGSGSQ